VAPQTDRFLDITSPLDGKVIGKVPLSTKAEVDKAVKAAHDALRSTPPIDRARCRCRASFCALMEATVVAGSVAQYNALTEGG
jgi:acyl-CoA reductase-like NAD-dependent aldehyde dehydrogenase